jgi:hypothetical protein
MKDNEGTGRDNLKSTISHHVCFYERDDVLVVRFIDVELELLNYVTLSEVREVLRDLVGKKQPRMLILDLERKNLIVKGPFFSMLCLLLKITAQSQGTLRLCNVPPLIADKLRSTRLIQVFPPYDSLEEALGGTVPDLSHLVWEQIHPMSPQQSAPAVGRLIRGESRAMGSNVPGLRERHDEILDIVHFATIVNCVILLVAGVIFLFLASLAPPDPLHDPDLTTVLLGVAGISLPVWCLSFGIWGWKKVRGRRRVSAGARPADLRDEWLDGPA